MKTLFWVLLIALVACVVYSVYSNRTNLKLEKEAVLMKQKIENQQIIIDEKSKEYLKLKDETEGKISELNAEIDSYNSVIAGKNDEIKIQDAKLKELREAQKVLTNKDEIIKNLKEQIFRLDKKFLLAQEQLKEKDKIIFALTGKYEYEHKLRLEAEGILDKFALQISDQDRLISNLEKQLSQKKRSSLIKQVGWGGIGLLLGMIVKK